MKLKSTYNPLAGLAPLPEGWTEHKAPDGNLRTEERRNGGSFELTSDRSTILLQ